MEKLKEKILFPTLIYHSVIEDLDVSYYLKSLYEYKKKFPKGVRKSNKGEGYQTEDDLHFLPPFISLHHKLNHFLSFSLDIPCNIVSLWGNISPPNSYNQTHTHPGCDMAGVLYLDTPPNSGDINFYDFSVYNRSYVHTPQQKEILVFPAHLHHSVDLNQSKQHRISISFNIHFQYP